MKKTKITLTKETAVSKAGNAYNYISVKADGVEITRLFYRLTEEGFYNTILGTYQKTDE